jgi:hypothetical protein
VENIESLLQLPPEVTMDHPEWEEDVLLSEGLPPSGVVDDATALLDFAPAGVDEDFQKMLNDWESHIGTLQVRLNCCN